MKKYTKLVLMFLFCGLTTGCPDDEPVKHEGTRQLGESCDANENLCLDGLLCESGTCRTICTSNEDCDHMSQCINGICVKNSNGQCNDGWEGAGCNTKTNQVCKEGRTGANCDQCATGYVGANCKKCPDCGHGQCVADASDNAVCQCTEGWAGSNCDQCAAGYIGANCEKCPECDHGECTSNPNNKAVCSCEEGWNGDHCDSEQKCNEGFTGTNCRECLSDHYGQNCELCNCKNGSCWDGIGGTGHCKPDTCYEGWQGSDCDQCANGYVGDECKKCPDCGIHGQCVAGNDGNPVCQCEDGIVGELCNQMEDNEGNVYKIVDIAGKVWMAENMKYTSGVTCYANIDEDKDFKKKYGCLYTMADAKKVCPSGWSLPQGQKDVAELMEAAKIAANSTEQKDIAEALKDISWNGNNKTGFSALPAGGWSSSQNSYTLFKSYAQIWTAESPYSPMYYMIYVSDVSGAYFVNENDAISVRCIKDSSK